MAVAEPSRLFMGQAPITTAVALYTAKARTEIRNIHVANVTAATASALVLNLVPKGGTAGVANQITGGTAAAGQSFTAAVATELVSTAGLGGLVLNQGDSIFGLATTAAANLTIIISGSVYGEA